jgi:hypothetical protein
MDDELLIVALRVLSAYMDFQEPDPIDVRQLRQAASAPQSAWDLDELARFVVQRELALRHPLAHRSRARGVMRSVARST